jgi:hypothetical protein
VNQDEKLLSLAELSPQSSCGHLHSFLLSHASVGYAVTFRHGPAPPPFQGPVPRDNELAKVSLSGNDVRTRGRQILILIDAPFSSRLSRYRPGLVPVVPVTGGVPVVVVEIRCPWRAKASV